MYAKSTRLALLTIFVGGLVPFVGCGSSPTESVAERDSQLLGGCTTHKQCEDGNPCTQDLCVLGVCAPALPIVGCCFNGTCVEAGGSGGSAGSSGSSGSGGAAGSGGKGSGGVTAGGTGGSLGLDCSRNEQCDDGDPCTQNLCALGVCVTLSIAGCLGQGGAGGEGAGSLTCTTDDQCADADPCTQDVCSAGMCAPVPVRGCCFLGDCNDGGGAGGQDSSGGGTSSGNASGASGGGRTGAGGVTGNEPGSEGGVGPTLGIGGDGTDLPGGGKTGTDTPDGNAGASDDPITQTEWVMEGGSCAVSARSRGPSGWLGLAGLAVYALWRRRRQHARRAPRLMLLTPLLLVLATSTARAAGFAQDGYTAPVAPDDLMWTERAASDSGHLRPFGRLTLGYTDDPLVLVDASDRDHQIRVVDDQFAAYGSFGVGFAHRAHLALLLPFYLQSSELSSAASQIKGARAGDLGIDGRFAILGRSAPLELGLAATVHAPTGGQNSYTSDGQVSAWLRALVSKQLTARGTLVNASLGSVLRPSTEAASTEIGSQLRFTVGGLVALSDLLGVTLEAAGSTLASDPFAKRSTPVEGAVGGRLTLPALVLGSSIGSGLTRGIGAPDFRWLVSLALPGPAKPEPDSPQRTAPGDADPDHDGILGSADACPDRAEDLDGFDDLDGCPDADNDKDGIADAQDKCPNDAEDKDGFDDLDGCPDADNDKDGIADAQDKCPNEAEDVDHFQDEDGCPDPDNDADGIADAQDKCPNEAETKNGMADDDGCPDLVRVEEGQIRTLEPIYFDNNKATIQSRSEALLLEMANLIGARPDLGVIAIEGHSDVRGSAKHNLELSRNRAASVRAWLIKSGVPAERLTSEGFGSTRPIDDNATAEGRAKNRRVEFHFGLVAAPSP